MGERRTIGQSIAEAGRSKTFQVVAGTLTGVLIIVVMVALSTLVFRAYGWGLFVLTPIVVGFTTGFLVNRHELRSMRATNGLVLLSAALGCFGLILFALEGLVCLIMAAPLGALGAVGGGALGRRAARIGKDPVGPIYCIALLPAMFALDASFPPAVTMVTSESIVIEASPTEVWQALISDQPILETPTLAGRLGLAYPRRAQLFGHRVGAMRIGFFSTGEARERVTDWDEGKLLAFTVLEQPPAMKEMSPHRHVHAPHVAGYFKTGETRFHLHAVNRSQMRLTIRATHHLQIDPIIYWEPIARWAISGNSRRVLMDLKVKAERR